MYPVNFMDPVDFENPIWTCGTVSPVNPMEPMDIVDSDFDKCIQDLHRKTAKYVVQLWSTALLLNEGIPRAYRGKKLRLKNILFFPSKSEGITLKFWWKYLQKVNAKRPQICDEK